jgi:polysaccharide pyruvyl transferase WcaK-like protein
VNPSGSVLILGGAAHQNRGDLAMQSGLVQWVRRQAPAAEVLFFSSDPEPTERAFGVPCQLAADSELATPWTRETPGSTDQRRKAIRRGRRFVRRAKWFRRIGWCPGSPTAKGYLNALANARCALVPGSGSMNSLWWHDWLYPKAFTVLAARAMGVPVAMTSQGVGPEFSHPLDASVAAEMFSACEIVGVRDDSTSAELLEGIGVPRDIVRHTGDDALLFESGANSASLKGDREDDVPIIGLNLRDSSTYQKGYAKHDPERYAQVLDAVASKRRVRFAFVPISYDQQDDDRVAAQNVIAAMDHADRAEVVTEELDAAQLRELCGSFDAAIGISYHFLLFSLAANVPSLLLHSNPYYAHKSKGLSRLYGTEEQAIDLGATSDADLEAAIHAMLDHAGERRDTLAATNKALESRAAETRREISQRLLGDAI